MAKITTGRWNDVPAYTGGQSERLELGGHYLQILKAEMISGTGKKSGQPYQMLKLYFDTAKIDPQAGFFGRKYEQSKNFRKDDAKWPNAGTGVVFIPFENETDNIVIGRWNGFLKILEESNSTPGKPFTWDMDTDSLKGKFIGGVFRDEEWMDDKGAIRLTQKLAWFCSVQAVPEATIPDTRTLSGGSTTKSEPKSDNDLDLPFDL